MLKYLSQNGNIYVNNVFVKMSLAMLDFSSITIQNKHQSTHLKGSIWNLA